MKKILPTVLLALSVLTLSASSAREPVLGGPCQGCENVFVEQPSELGWSARIAPLEEPGEPLVIEGTVRSLLGKAAPGIIVYAYQTNAAGIYPAASTRHGKLRAWAKSDEQGRYRFLTVRPGSYPGTKNPQHVHLHVIEPGKGTYYIDDILFEDDPLLTPRQRKLHERLRGGSGVCRPQKGESGQWKVRRDIVLGQNVPGY